MIHGIPIIDNYRLTHVQKSNQIPLIKTYYRLINFVFLNVPVQNWQILRMSQISATISFALVV